jgi:hypothetical protein
MRTLARTSLVAAAVTTGLLIVLAMASTLPGAPLRAAGALLAEFVHLACALVAGAAILRLLRASPPNALSLLVFASSTGLALLSLLTLLLSALGLTHPVTPWLADALALVGGAGRIRPLIGSLRDAWARLDLSFVMASQIPLLAALATVSLVHLAPPFLPSGPGTGAAEQALNAQAAVRGSLSEALAARADSAATPVDGLLLHGRLVAGEAGARLHVAVLAALLTAGTFLHARRRLGGRTAAWVGLCIASSPALLLLDAASPSGTWIALMAFLFFAELSDWSARPAPGKVVLAFSYGGLCAAQSAAGLAAFASVLIFLVLVEALVERHALHRLLAGVAGLVMIAGVTALPFIVADSWLQERSPWASAKQRWVAAPAAGLQAGWASAGAGLLDADADLDEPLHRIATLGPLILCLLLLTPLAPEAPEGLRHAVVMLLLALGCWALPPPWGTGALVLASAAVCAGATASALLASGGMPARLTAGIVALAAPVTLLLVVNAGPDLFAGAGIMTGATSRADALARSIPDHELIAESERRLGRRDQLILIGGLTDCQYSSAVLRWPAALLLEDGQALSSALRSADVTHAAVDHSASEAPGREVFEGFERLDSLPEEGPFALYRVPLLRQLPLEGDEELPREAGGAPPGEGGESGAEEAASAPSR